MKNIVRKSQKVSVRSTTEGKINIHKNNLSSDDIKPSETLDKFDHDFHFSQLYEY